MAQSVAAVADSGSADAGIASRAIANVAANDTVNGAPALLGTAGNATVSQSGTWPRGIALDPATGAITTAKADPAGTYEVAYQLCDLSAPPDCATATDTISIITPAVLPAPDTGSAVLGHASRPIANVAANDTVNAAPAILGASGNATVAPVGPWPAGLTLSTATGAVLAGASTAAGTYSVDYELCDRNVPADCVTTTDTVLVIAPVPEVRVSTLNFGDVEWDWGRDGVYCATCNFGQGNARFSWTDESGNLWVGHIDPMTGQLTPASGDNELVDTTAFDSTTYGNGPEWAFSSQGGEVISQLVYTRYAPGTSPASINAAAAFATSVAGGWSRNFFPGVLPVSRGGSAVTVAPLASQCNSDPVALAYFYTRQPQPQVFEEPVSTAAGTAPFLTPIGAYATELKGSKRAASWTPCTHQLVFLGTAPDDEGNLRQQVFWYDLDSNVVQQLTFEPQIHTEAFMFQAPEFGDAYVIYALTDDRKISVYEQNGSLPNGAPTFQLVNSIASPDPAEPYIVGTEPFINCTPQCQTYIFMRLQAVPPPSGAPGATIPNGVAVTNIDPAHPMFRILMPLEATPNIQRLDLEYYITAKGPYLYYQRNTVQSPTTTFRSWGRYYIDTQLGAPSGPCVGSSAEAGMAAGC